MAPDPAAAQRPDWASLDKLFAGDRWASPHTKNIGRRRLYRRVLRRQFKALRRMIRKLLSPTPRDTERVTGIYDDQYAPSTEEFVRSRGKRRDAFLLGGRPVLGERVVLDEFRNQLIERVVDLAGAERVLEVGSGRGVNLVSLALTRPQLELNGIELTRGRRRSQRRARSRPAAGAPRARRRR